MRLLALDASLRQCSAALLDGAAGLATAVGGDSRAAASALPGLVAGLTRQHGRFDAVGVTVGPGSFTGLRAALAFAHGLSLGAALPLVGVTVAEALLAGEADPATWVALDARREGRVYLGQGAAAMAVHTLDALPRPQGPVRVVGDAAPLVVAAWRRAGLDAVDAGGHAVDPAAVGQVARRRLRGELPPCAPQILYLSAPEAHPAGNARPAPLGA